MSNEQIMNFRTRAVKALENNKPLYYQIYSGIADLLAINLDLEKIKELLIRELAKKRYLNEITTESMLESLDILSNITLDQEYVTEKLSFDRSFTNSSIAVDLEERAIQNQKIQTGLRQTAWLDKDIRTIKIELTDQSVIVTFHRKKVY